MLKKCINLNSATQNACIHFEYKCNRELMDEPSYVPKRQWYIFLLLPDLFILRHTSFFHTLEFFSLQFLGSIYGPTDSLYRSTFRRSARRSCTRALKMRTFSLQMPLNFYIFFSTTGIIILVSTFSPSPRTWKPFSNNYVCN